MCACVIIWWDAQRCRALDFRWTKKKRNKTEFVHNFVHEKKLYSLGNFWLWFGSSLVYKKQPKQNRQKRAWLLLHELCLSRCSQDIGLVRPLLLLWQMNQVEKKKCTHIASEEKKTRNYILRYSPEIDVRLSTTQLCLSDCNLIISITALAFKCTQNFSLFLAGWNSLAFFPFSLPFWLKYDMFIHMLAYYYWVPNSRRREMNSSFALSNNRWMHFIVCKMWMQLRLVVLLRFIDRPQLNLSHKTHTHSICLYIFTQSFRDHPFDQQKRSKRTWKLKQ